jgi:asparagine synthetase B (glutamine-hydrolysing)
LAFASKRRSHFRARRNAGRYVPMHVLSYNKGRLSKRYYERLAESALKETSDVRDTHVHALTARRGSGVGTDMHMNWTSMLSLRLTGLHSLSDTHDSR